MNKSITEGAREVTREVEVIHGEAVEVVEAPEEEATTKTKI